MINHVFTVKTSFGIFITALHFYKYRDDARAGEHKILGVHFFVNHFGELLRINCQLIMKQSEEKQPPFIAQCELKT